MEVSLQVTGPASFDQPTASKQVLQRTSLKDGNDRLLAQWSAEQMQSLDSEVIYASRNWP